MRSANCSIHIDRYYTLLLDLKHSNKSKLSTKINHEKTLEDLKEMRIFEEDGLIKFSPESEKETQELTTLWNLLIDCVEYNRKLVPVGEYVPIKKNEAHFTVEG